MKRRFKEARLQKQMKVIEVAKLFEVAQSTVSAWETERKEPSIDTIARLCLGTILLRCYLKQRRSRQNR